MAFEKMYATAKKIAVLDRTKEPGSLGEPLFLDVVTALREAGRDAEVIGGRYGLGSKDTPPSSVFAVYEELAKAEPKTRFTIGIVDDVTGLSLDCLLYTSKRVPHGIDQNVKTRRPAFCRAPVN